MKKPALKRSKYYFTLHDLDTRNLHKLYNINIDVYKPNDTTDLHHLDSTNHNIGTVSFLDESKRPHLCNVSMIDYKRKQDINGVPYNCFWCRHPFTTRPIGCPVRYVPNQAKKQYYSHISKVTYTIIENVTSLRGKDVQCDENDIIVQDHNYYETDGIFCSFNCCKAFIDDNSNVKLYTNSNMLLTRLYKDITQSKLMKRINPAPHWRVLREYGGHVDINKFRNNFDKIDYKDHGTIRFFPIGRLYEDKIKF